MNRIKLSVLIVVKDTEKKDAHGVDTRMKIIKSQVLKYEKC